MNKCKDCYEMRETYGGDKQELTYQYCGVIEEAIEDAIEIKDIKECPRDVLKAKYRVGKYERKPIDEKWFMSHFKEHNRYYFMSYDCIEIRDYEYWFMSGTHEDWETERRVSRKFVITLIEEMEKLNEQI